MLQLCIEGVVEANQRELDPLVDLQHLAIVQVSLFDQLSGYLDDLLEVPHLIRDVFFDFEIAQPYFEEVVVETLLVVGVGHDGLEGGVVDHWFVYQGFETVVLTGVHVTVDPGGLTDVLLEVVVQVQVVVYSESTPPQPVVQEGLFGHIE